METATAAEEVRGPPEHQLLLTPGNVALTLSGDKTETRRLMRPPPKPTRPSVEYRTSEALDTRAFARWIEGSHQRVMKCPYGRPGDTLWTRETWQLCRFFDDGDVFEWHGKGPESHPGGDWQLVYAADGHPEHIDDRGWKWRPNIFMPRWACRLLLRVEEIAVEQLHDITDVGAHAEGLESVEAYRELWNKLHPKAKWDDVNPYVWVVKYSRVVPEPEA